MNCQRATCLSDDGSGLGLGWRPHRLGNPGTHTGGMILTSEQHDCLQSRCSLRTEVVSMLATVSPLPRCCLQRLRRPSLAVYSSTTTLLLRLSWARNPRAIEVSSPADLLVLVHLGPPTWQTCGFIAGQSGMH